MSLINKKKSMIIKETKDQKESSVKKERKTSKKIKNNVTLDSILENDKDEEDEDENTTFSNPESQNDNLLDNNDNNANNANNDDKNINNDDDNDNDNLDEILQEINDSEIAMAMDASFASNIAMQLNNNIPIEEDMDSIIRQISQKEILEEDENIARELELENEINNTGVSQEEDISDILEQIRIFEESEKLKAERQSIRELQDYEYEQSLQADMQRMQRIKHVNQTNQNLDIPIPVSVPVTEAIQKEEIVIKTDTPLTVEEIRKARIAYYSKK
jgi:hypothetical protein